MATRRKSSSAFVSCRQSARVAGCKSTGRIESVRKRGPGGVGKACENKRQKRRSASEEAFNCCFNLNPQTYLESFRGDVRGRDKGLGRGSRRLRRLGPRRCSAQRRARLVRRRRRPLVERTSFLCTGRRRGGRPREALGHGSSGGSDFRYWPIAQATLRDRVSRGGRGRLAAPSLRFLLEPKLPILFAESLEKVECRSCLDGAFIRRREIATAAALSSWSAGGLIAAEFHRGEIFAT